MKNISYYVCLIFLLSFNAFSGDYPGGNETISPDAISTKSITLNGNEITSWGQVGTGNVDYAANSGTANVANVANGVTGPVSNTLAWLGGTNDFLFPPTVNGTPIATTESGSLPVSVLCQTNIVLDASLGNHQRLDITNDAVILWPDGSALDTNKSWTMRLDMNVGSKSLTITNVYFTTNLTLNANPASLRIRTNMPAVLLFDRPCTWTNWRVLNM